MREREMNTQKIVLPTELQEFRNDFSCDCARTRQVLQFAMMHVVHCVRQLAIACCRELRLPIRPTAIG